MMQQVKIIHKRIGRSKEQGKWVETTERNGDETHEMFPLVPSQGKYVYVGRCSLTKATNRHKGVTFNGENTTKECPLLH
jgi:hypothetical protein